MGSGIHVELAAEGVAACPVTAASESVEVESVVTTPNEDGVVGEVTLTRPDGEGTALGEAAERVFDDGERSVYRFEADGDCPCGRLPDHGCPVRDVHADGGTLVLSFLVGDLETVRTIVTDLRSCCESVRVRRLTRSAPDDDSTLLFVDRSAFTDRQYEVLRTAHEMGYFDQPKAASADEVATELDIAPATFSEHLATTQSKLLDQILAV